MKASTLIACLLTLAFTVVVEAGCVDTYTHCRDYGHSKAYCQGLQNQCESGQ